LKAMPKGGGGVVGLTEEEDEEQSCPRERARAD